MGSLTGVVASKSVTEASKGALRTIGNRPHSLTGVVASKSVTEAPKGALRPIGNRPQSVMAEGRLTGRPTGRAGRKLEHSDPAVPYGRAVAQRIKGTPGITG